jgi:type II pantothenate kinase
MASNIIDGQFAKLSLDIGGSLTKVASLGNDNQNLGLQAFPTQELPHYLGQFAELHKDKQGRPVISVTGGGAQKFSGAIKAVLGEDVHQVDEMQALASGVAAAIEKEAFYFDTTTGSLKALPLFSEDEFLVVNVGSGVSIIKASKAGKAERLAGTSIGGGTLVGLMRHCYGQDVGFHEIVVDCISGDNRNVDLLVGDIYGNDYLPGLSSDIVASSFGKVSSASKREDFASGILQMVVNNFTELAWLVSDKASPSSKKVVFTGSFYEGEGEVFRELTGRALMHWDSSLQAVFIPHSGFTTAIGALLHRDRMH